MLLRTLGEFQLLDEAGSTVLLTASKPLALLTYLALADRGPVTRDHLVDLLWGNVSTERGRHALRQTLHALRRDLGPDLIELSGNRISCLPIGSDRGAFLAAAKDLDPMRALAIYRGPFLPDVAFPGGDRFEQWATRVRDRLHDLWLALAASSTEHLLEQGDAAAALLRAEELRLKAPESEAIWRLLIAGHLQQGNSRAARLEAERLQQFLATVGTKPETATAELLRRCLRADGDEPAASPRDLLAEPELVGRDTAFAWLLGTWRRSTNGPLQVVHVNGGAGIGKSRLLESLASRISSAGGGVVRCRAFPGERSLAYATLAASIERLASSPGATGIDPASAEVLISLVPSLAPVFPASRPRQEYIPEPHVLLAALTDLLRSLAHERPLTVLLDDLHWGDQASLEILGTAVNRSQALPLLVVTASRHMAGLPGCESRPLLLEPLEPAMISRLLTSIGDLPERDATWLVHRIHAATDGNPMLVLELLRMLIGERALALEEGTWQVTDRDRLDTVLVERPPLLDRARQLGVLHNRLLEALAVVGHPLTTTALAEIVGMGDSVEAALTSLELAGLARSSGDRWEMSHDRFAESLLAELDPDRHRALRRDAAAVLLDQGRDDEGLLRLAAAHAASAGDAALLSATGRLWISARRRAGATGSARHLIQQLAVASGTTSSLAALMRGVPWHASTGNRVAMAAVGVAVVLAIVTLPGTRSPTHRLRLDGEPMLDWVRGTEPGLRDFAAPITVRAVDPDGQRDTMATGTIRARVTGSTATLEGETAVALRDGEAVFDALQVRFGQDTLVHVELAADGHGVFATVPLALNDNERATLHLLAASLNHQELDPDRPVLRIAPGDSITGSVTLRYRSDWESASVILCAVGTWSRGPAGTWPIAPQRTPVSRATIRRQLRLPGPPRPGDYHLILVFRAETDCTWIASQTNWFHGTPSWDDGQDIADISPEELSQARERGYLTRELRQDSVPRLADYALQGIRVEVR